MTNNQREFQKEVNRIQRELAQLQQTHHFKHIAPIPEQPKRITRAKLDEIKSLRGRDLLPDEYKVSRSKKGDDKPHRTRSAKTDINQRKFGERAERIDKGLKRDTPSPLKGRTSPLKGRPSPLKGTKRKNPSPLKGKKRGALSPEERARRNAKRLETISKSNKPRKTRKDKGTHLTAEERARRNAKRLETIAKKSRPASSEFAPQDQLPEKDYHMVEWLLERIEEAIDHSVLEGKVHMGNPKSTYDVYERMNYLFQLRALVDSNRESTEYYNTLSDRQSKIASYLDSISWYIPPDTVEDVYDPYTAYTELYQLLTPTGELNLMDTKRISEASEEYVNNALAR